MKRSTAISPISGFVLGLFVAAAFAAPGLVSLTSSGEEPVGEVEEVVCPEVVEESPAPDESVDGGEGGDTNVAVRSAEDPALEGEGSEECSTEEVPEELEESPAVEVVEEEEDLDATVKLEGENHGAAVSTAAHCPIKGRAHGVLVSGIAQDKDATVEDAQAACDAALAELEADDATDLAVQTNKPDKVKNSGKPEAPGQTKKSASAEAQVETEDSGPGPSSPSVGKGKGRGNKG